MENIRFETIITVKPENIPPSPGKSLAMKLFGEDSVKGEPPKEIVKRKEEKGKYASYWDRQKCSIIFEDENNLEQNIKKTIEFWYW